MIYKLLKIRAPLLDKIILLDANVLAWGKCMCAKYRFIATFLLYMKNNKIHKKHLTRVGYDFEFRYKDNIVVVDVQDTECLISKVNERFVEPILFNKIDLNKMFDALHIIYQEEEEDG
jgi:hypothetical protein